MWHMKLYLQIAIHFQMLSAYSMVRLGGGKQRNAVTAFGQQVVLDLRRELVFFCAVLLPWRDRSARSSRRQLEGQEQHGAVPSGRRMPKPSPPAQPRRVSQLPACPSSAVGHSVRIPASKQVCACCSRQMELLSLLGSAPGSQGNRCPRLCPLVLKPAQGRAAARRGVPASLSSPALCYCSSLA